MRGERGREGALGMRRKDKREVKEGKGEGRVQDDKEILLGKSDKKRDGKGEERKV